MVRRLVISIALEIVIGTVTQRDHPMGEGTIGRKRQAREEELVSLLVLVGEEMPQTEIEVQSRIGRIVFV